MRSTKILLILLFVCVALSAERSSKAFAGSSGDAVAKIGKSVVTLEEYEKIQAKSLGNRAAAKAATLADREKFLDLIVNYKLKLIDAYRRGLDRQPEIISELQQYRGSLAESFLVERDITGPGVRRMYDRRAEEIRARHILLTLGQQASPSDSIAAYALATSLIQRLKAGEDFGTLAVEFSQDPSAKQNKGDLYYFSAGQMVSSFEDAVYNLKAGEMTPVPIRSRFGLHIISVIARGPSRGEISASHIMVRFASQNPSADDTLAAYKKILAYRDSLKAGASFAGIAERHSEDPGSASKGGDLGFFSRRRWVMPFDEAAFRLKEGQLSGIVRSPYGYHLITCTGERPRSSFEDAKAEIAPIYQQLRAQDDFAAYLGALKTRLAFSLDEKTAKMFFAALDTNKNTRDSAWYASIPKKLGSAVLMTFGKRTVTVDSVVSLMRTRPEFASIDLRKESLVPALDKLSELLTFGLRSETLEADNAEFASIMRDYKEGVLLYQSEQDNVWNKIAANDSLLRLYFGKHRDRFIFPDRVNGTELRCAGVEAALEVSARLAKGAGMEAIAREDSARMAMPSSFTALFARGSATLPALKKMVAALDELKKDSLLTLRLTAFPDTLKNKKANAALASKRLEALKNALLKQASLDPKRLTVNAGGPAGDKLQNTVTVDIVGRRPLVSGKPLPFILAKTEDLAQAADTLFPGRYSMPFSRAGYFSIVRLNAQEPTRQKTFEEAGPEVSSAFQESESQRLTNQWLDGLKKENPVVKYTEVLKEAFSEEK